MVPKRFYVSSNNMWRFIIVHVSADTKESAAALAPALAEAYLAEQRLRYPNFPDLSYYSYGPWDAIDLDKEHPELFQRHRDNFQHGTVILSGEQPPSLLF